MRVSDFLNSRTLRYILIVLLVLLVISFQLNIESSRTRNKIERTLLSHQQEVWLGALEWCESRGDNTAINPLDNDGTASYYAFQFKPSTFSHFAKKYAIEGKISDYEAQKAIVEQMILDKSVNLGKQFPNCVKKLGLPSLLLDT